MKICVLVDNKTCDGSNLQAEHGLSIWFALNGKNYLVDVGASSLFVENAARLGIDIADVDVLILSHAHADHTGGLAAFIENNDKAAIYVSQHVCGNSYYSTRRGSKRSISIDAEVLSSCGDRVQYIDGNAVVDEGVTIVSDILCTTPVPKANGTLYVNDMLDDFAHEMAVVADVGDERVLLSPCSHKGILNILNAVGGASVTRFVGGLHLLDSDDNFQFEECDEIVSLANEIKACGVTLYTGHCTGETAKGLFSDILGDRFAEFYSGFTLDI
jgi:7,8-dihydropterin-6-yl-methyl-4-(beta-D-ribofuranosyl)aminobenzene 5'-phosphate synthase